MEVVSSNKQVYYPTLDVESGKYIDICPIPPYNRNKNLEYHCLCNNYVFYNMTEYKKHIKLKSHQRFLDNYLYYIEDVEYAKQQAIEYRKLYEITNKKLILAKLKSDEYYKLYEITNLKLLELLKINEISKEMNNVD